MEANSCSCIWANDQLCALPPTDSSLLNGTVCFPAACGDRAPLTSCSMIQLVFIVRPLPSQIDADVSLVVLLTFTDNQPQRRALDQIC
ncbi:conserved hypothetical protein [Ricinus communis]|uniref:Uncharacterized protein n=1 Tax=Ricinus communis TaxID=3988 RepID=B9SX60_RICCO|nr:conserved hypothetical protein [Ricinus communis]